MKRIIAFIMILLTLLGAVSCNGNGQSRENNQIGDDGYWYVDGEKTNVKANKYDDPNNPQGLEFHLQPDGSYYVAAGSAKLLSRIVIPGSYNGRAVSGIRNEGFAGCDTLKEIVVKAALIEIGDKAFSGCINLEFFGFNHELQVIGESAFKNCEKLLEVRLYANVREIGVNAFSTCGGIKRIYISKGLVEAMIGREAFPASGGGIIYHFDGDASEWTAIRTNNTGTGLPINPNRWVSDLDE